MESDKKPETPKTEESSQPTEQEIQPNTEDVKKKTFDVFSSYMQSFSNPRSMRFFGEKQFKQLVKEHAFWDSQPVVKAKQIAKGDIGVEQGALESRQKKDVRQEPYELPAGFEWGSVDLDDPEQLDELYKLLHDHYVEDDDGYFRFDYAKEFLRWALSPPNYEKELAFAIRVKKTKKMMAFISGIFIELQVEDKHIRATEVNFLCVHKMIRNHRVAPVLIKEVTRRSNVRGVWQGFFTSGQILPTPFAQARYYHRSLNPKKLIDVNFSSLPQKQTMRIHQKLHAVPEQTSIPGLRVMEEKDLNQVRKLLNSYLEKFSLREIYSKKEVKHFFMPRDKVMNSFVVENKGVVSDFISFYSLPSSILNHKKYKTLNAAYSYYVIPGEHSLLELYKNALILAKQLDFDVFNALDILDNKEIFEDLSFKPGDGFLHYYFYNWKLKNNYLLPNQIGKVLV